LKAPEFPWELTDKKNHKFVYSLLCHEKPLVESDVFENAYVLNTPIWAAIVDKEAQVKTRKFFELVETPNCQITAFKRAERD
jgi:alpha-mannosidase